MLLTGYCLPETSPNGWNTTSGLPKELVLYSLRFQAHSCGKPNEFCRRSFVSSAPRCSVLLPLESFLMLYFDNRAGLRSRVLNLLHSHPSPNRGRVAQLGERGVRNAEVEGSNPFASTKARTSGF